MVPDRARAAGNLRGIAMAVLCLLTGLLVASVTAMAAAPAAAKVDQMDAGAKQRTRFVIGLERAVEPRIFTLASPNRVIVDLPDIAVHLPTLTEERPTGLVRSLRGGLAAADRYRVVIDVTEPVIIERQEIEPARDGRMPRLVIEITPVEAPKASVRRSVPEGRSGAGLGSVQPPLPKPAERPEVRAAKAFKELIVLDPGHGGHDTGAMSHGAVEKDVVLAFSLMLRDRLQATGRYRVLMTREDDRFIPLDDRREFAEQHKAALFMAIHADSAGSHARGATVYSLREGVANDLKRSARGEVVKSVLSDKELKALRQANVDTGTVQGFLAGLAEKEVLVTRERTSVFARSLVRYMSASTKMMDNPDRSAAFTVLRTAKVPAVLVELAFVTNREDAARLKSEQWRASVSNSLVDAIDAYFANPASSPLR